MIDSARRIRPNEDVVSRRMGEDLVLVQLETNQIFELNRTGARLWELIREGKSLEELRTIIRSEFRVEAERLDREIDRLLQELKDQHLVVDDDEEPTR